MILYESNELQFTHQGICNLDVDGTVVEGLNGEYELEFEYPIDDKYFFEIKHRRIVYCKPNPHSLPQPFRIYGISKTINRMILVNAAHISYDLSGYTIEPFKGGSALQTTDQMNANKMNGCPFTFHTDITEPGKVETVAPQSARSIIGNNISRAYKPELYFDNFNVHLKASRGSNNGVEIRYGKNMLDMEQEENMANIYTAVYPFWYREDDETGILITLPEKTLSTPGNWDFTRVYVLDLSSEFEVPPEQDDIRKITNKYIEDAKLGIPKVSLNLSYIQLSQSIENSDKALMDKVELGDTVTVVFEDAGISTTARCIKTTYSTAKNRYEKIELGEAQRSLANGIVEANNEIVEKIENDKDSNRFYFEKVVEELTNAITGNSGGYVRFNPPKNPSEILIMDRDDIDKAVVVWRWNKSGLGVSRSGYNGPYVGIAQNGKLIIDDVTANKISALLIEGGLFKSINNVSWIDMDTGNFNFGDKMKFDGTHFTIDLSNENLMKTDEAQQMITDQANSILLKVANTNKIVSKNVIPNGDFTNDSGISTIGKWVRNTISVSPVRWSGDGAVWANFYSLSTAGELFAYNEFEVDTSKTYEFSCKIAKYSTSSQYYCVRIQEYVSEEWKTVKEFTGTVNNTRDNPIVLIGSYKPTVNKARIWVGKVDGKKFDIYATDFQLFYESGFAKSSEIKVLEDSITSKVSVNDFGTMIQQNQYSVKIAWNKISNYVQFENGGISIYNGSVDTTKKRAVFDEVGNHFWRDGYYLGKIGTNSYTHDSSLKGFVFDLEPGGSYMTWSTKKSSDENTYKMMWTYANKTVGSYGAGMLHAGCDIDMHNWNFKNYDFDGGGITGTLTFTQVVEMNSNGVASRWFNNSKLVFIRGVLIDATWGNV